jgi:hypothetical protein
MVTASPELKPKFPSWQRADGSYFQRWIYLCFLTTIIPLSSITLVHVEVRFEGEVVLGTRPVRGCTFIQL